MMSGDVPTRPGMTRENLRQVILGAQSGYEIRGIPVEDIGNGHCENFAYDVLDAWAGQDWHHREWQDGRWGTTGTENLMSPDEVSWDWGLIEARYGPVSEDRKAEIDDIALVGANHVWIELDGKAYDAEHPEGVEDPFRMMFFRRHIDARKVGNPSP